MRIKVVGFLNSLIKHMIEHLAENHHRYLVLYCFGTLIIIGGK